VGAAACASAALVTALNAAAIKKVLIEIRVIQPSPNHRSHKLPAINF
jgi:hypothetical protein